MPQLHEEELDRFVEQVLSSLPTATGGYRGRSRHDGRPSFELSGEGVAAELMASGKARPGERGEGRIRKRRDSAEDPKGFENATNVAEGAAGRSRQSYDKATRAQKGAEVAEARRRAGRRGRIDRIRTAGKAKQHSDPNRSGYDEDGFAGWL